MEVLSLEASVPVGTKSSLGTIVKTPYCHPIVFETIRLALKHNGRPYGGFVRGFIVGNDKTFGDIDIWFRSDEDALNFRREFTQPEFLGKCTVTKIEARGYEADDQGQYEGVPVVPSRDLVSTRNEAAPKSGYPLKITSCLLRVPGAAKYIRDATYMSMLTEYLVAPSDATLPVDIVVSDQFPVFDFDVNCLAIAGLTTIEDIPSSSTNGPVDMVWDIICPKPNLEIATVLEHIASKTIDILPDWLNHCTIQFNPLNTTVKVIVHGDVYPLIHSLAVNHIPRRIQSFLDKGWTFNRYASQWTELKQSIINYLEVGDEHTERCQKTLLAFAKLMAKTSDSQYNFDE